MTHPIFAKQLMLSTAISSILLLSACNDSNSIPDDKIVTASVIADALPALGAGSTVRSLSLPALNDLTEASLGDVSFSAAPAVTETGKTIPFNVGFGSGAFHMPGDEAGIFYTITDSGPNIKCSDSEKITGISELCGADNSADKIFPIADFTPSIYKFHLVENGSSLSLKILERIELKNNSGKNITGLTNNLKATNTEKSFDAQGNLIDFDNEGVDTEALVRLKDGTFWLSEEYGPSLLHVAADGKVLERVVPETVAADLADADYKVSGLLPDVLKYRPLNRGIESIAVSPDEDYLYFTMQSPLAHPDKGAYKASRHVRIVKFALVNGELGEQLGEYIYRIDAPHTFNNPDNEGDSSTKQSSIKVSEMTAVGKDDLIILERNSSVTKLYRVNLINEVNIKDTDLSKATVTVKESAEPKTLEQVFDLHSAGAMSVSKALVFNSLTDVAIGTLPNKVEGIAWLDDKHVLLINDNDFGISGDDSVATIIEIGERFTATATKPQNIKMTIVGRYQSDSPFGSSAAEIVSFHKASQRIYIVNASETRIDVLDASGLTSTELENPITATNMQLDFSINVNSDLSTLALGAANSVTVHGNLLAVAVEASVKQDTGVIVFYTLNEATGAATYLKHVTAGALPDSVVFTPDGSAVIVANEGEPNDDVTHDPEGSISIIKVIAGVPENTATAITFTDFNAGGSRASELPDEVRIFTPNSSVAQDLEPEYVAVSDDSKIAFVSLQENNAVAIIDITSATITKIAALGFKDYNIEGNEIDVSNKDDAINIVKQPGVVGMYQPDTIASYAYNGQNYFVTANEGDARDYSGFSEEERVKDILLDAEHPQFANNNDEATLGRLKTTNTLGDTDGDGDFDVVYSYGARSFSIWDEQGRIVFDSQSDIEKITAGRLGENFNNNDSRSDDKGAEPEGLTIGKINDRTYAFVGLERTGGILMYDITSPYGAQFVQYLTNGDLTATDDALKGDIAPEGMKFVQATDSPTAYSLLIVGNEVSGSTTVIEIK
jgi:hypothetical protein